jgi:NitT/TauT family transport system substrate-binding protein
MGRKRIGYGSSGYGISRRQFGLGLGSGMLAMPALTGLASAQVTSIRLGKQYGLPFLPQMVMESQKLIEKHAGLLGLPTLTADWMTLAGPGALNDALLSGSIEFINVAAPSLATLWSKTVGTSRPIKALCAVQSMPYVLVTRNPTVKTIADLGEQDKIAVPTVKISGQAMALQMAAAKLWGNEQWAKLDPLTVTMGHPDAVTAMLSGQSHVTTHFCVAPFHYYELAKPEMRAILKSYDVFGGPHTNGIQVANEQFYTDNPKICQAVFNAHEEANALIKKNPGDAAQIYLTVSKDSKTSVAELVKMISDPDINYTTTPANVMQFCEFMNKTGRLKTLPGSWKDMFLPVAHGLSGT